MAKKTKQKDYIKGDVFKVLPELIEVEEGFNVRKKYNNLDDLARSIAEIGQLEPCIVFKRRGENKYILTDGHRRFNAILRGREMGLDIPRVNVIMGSQNPEDRLIAMLETGSGREPLSTLEQAEVIKRLLNAGYKPKEICAKLSRISIGHVYNLKDLSNAPKEIKNFIDSGKINSSTVIQLMRELKDPDALLKAVKNAIDNFENGKVNKTDGEELDNNSGDGKSSKQPRKKKSASIDDVSEDIKTKPHLQRIRELIETLEADGCTSESFGALKDLMEGLEKKESLKQLRSYFK